MFLVYILQLVIIVFMFAIVLVSSIPSSYILIIGFTLLGISEAIKFDMYLDK